MDIKFIDLDSQYELIKDSLNEKLNNIFSCKKFIMGPYVQELEDKLQEYTGSKHCLSCASGTEALLIPLMALNIGPGDAVITTPFTFMATAEVISMLGATPIFVDIDHDTYNIDPTQIELAITAVLNQDPQIYPLPEPAIKNRLNLKAIIAVDLFGQVADYDTINKIAEKYNLHVIEDAAQSFGSMRGNKKSCNITDIASTSFFPAKPLGCYGDGGAVFTDNTELYNVMKSIRVHGQGANKYENIRIGLNSRMDTIQAAVVLEKLNIFDTELKQRKLIAEKYNVCFSENQYLKPPVIPDTCSWAQYSLCYNHPTDTRDDLLKRLDTHKIPTNIYYPTPLHLQKAFEYLNYKQTDFPISESISKKIFSIPMNPYLQQDQIEKIVDIIQKETKGI